MINRRGSGGIKTLNRRLSSFGFSTHERGAPGRFIPLSLSLRLSGQKSADAERGKPQFALRHAHVVVNIERPVERIDSRLFGCVNDHNGVASLDDRATEDGHVDVWQSVQAAPERIEIPLDKAQLIQRAHPPYRFGCGPEASRRSLYDL